MSDTQDTWKPGHQLRTMREEAKISLDSIAKETLIPFNKLQLLEADDYEKIGKPVFVIAYIRKYAKSLGIHSDPFVEQLKLHTGMETGASSIESSTSADKPLTANSFRFPKIPALAVIPLLIVLWLLSVWLLKDDEPQETKAVQSGVTESNESIQSSAVSQQQQRHTPTVVQEEKEEEFEEFEDDSINPGDLSTEETANQGADDVVVERMAGEQGDILVLSFFEECWVEVKDANGEVIFAQLQNSGDNLRLSGKAPFNVMLGNARAVDLVVNGRRVSTEPPSGRRTMKFDVGP